MRSKELDNIKEWMEEAERKHGEPVLAAVVGPHYCARHRKAKDDENVLLTREAAFAKVDAPFNSGFAGADCFPIIAWTENWVLFIGEYDGATSLSEVPRNPVACTPEFF